MSSSSASKPFTLRWGIIATGSISSQFTKDLVLPPADRLPSSLKDAGVDVSHVVTAVGSRSVASAEKFIASNLPSELQAGAHACGSYADVFARDDVDIVYIGTPHTYHYENTLDALNAGKHVLCEKPFTFDLAELDELIALAKRKNLFLMEAVWTRFHPIAYAVQHEVHSGKHGKLLRVIADLSFDMKPDEREREGDRMVDPKLGGGALLDLGPYPMVWTMMLIHQHPSNTSRRGPSKVTGHMSIYERSGVDASSAWVAEWKDVGAHAVCTASMVTPGSKEQCVIVQMEKADLHLAFPTYRPEHYKIVPKSTVSGDAANTSSNDWVHVPIPASQGRGMNYQADECARRIRDGQIESERCGWEESRIVMDVFDKVREQGGYVVKKGKAGSK